MKNKSILLCFLILLIHPLLYSQNIPSIPDGEVIRYKTVVGKRNGETEYSSQSISLISEENREFYLVRSSSSAQSTETMITADTFIPVSMSKRIYGERSDIATTVALLNEPRLSADEIAVLDTNDLANILRAYPFENPRDMNLLFLGQGGEEMSSMSFRIIFNGEETVSLNNREYDAWKLEMKADLSGAMALFSSMIPKTIMWFSKEDSHHLLKMTGSRGPGADNVVNLEMISYTK
ncbi:MAG: hypothetical protein JXR86_15715 [Spirochaetales bacterium]|nr:hypothetical protein [Spirochaetales bacterium]